METELAWLRELRDAVLAREDIENNRCEACMWRRVSEACSGDEHSMVCCDKHGERSWYDARSRERAAIIAVRRFREAPNADR